MTTGILIQARTTSSRFPNKVFHKINGKYSIEYVIEECLASKKADKVVLVVPHNEKYTFFKSFGEKYENLFVIGGASNDLVSRFWTASNILSLDIIVRITGDCICLMSELIDNTIEFYQNNNFDYVSNFALKNSTNQEDAHNHASETFLCDGFSCEVFGFLALQQAYMNAQSNYDKEHATTWIKRNLNCGLYNQDVLTLNGKFSLDEEKDLEVIEAFLLLKNKGFIKVNK